MQRLFIVHGYFFARTNVAEREEHYVAVDGSHIGIGLAGMVDVMGAVAAAAAVDAPDTVDIADAEFCSMGAALRLAIGNSFASVFGDLTAPREMNGGKTTLTIN